MGLNSFKKEIAADIVAPELAKNITPKSGLILSARYDTDTDLSTANNGGGVIIDVAIYDETSENNKVLKDVPMTKIPGFSQSLPPIGSTAIIIFLNGNSTLPICIGVLPNKITNPYTTDHTSARIPPKNLS